MQKPIIEVKSISKSYRLGTISLATFFDDLYLLGQKVGLLSKKNNNDKNFLALNDVSFSVNRGEIIGIIGTNGAGKINLCSRYLAG
jgi:ABC-type polysaccharide/polyol phosphate transport system ATPase subunit